jgi:hypothetical protein
VDALEAALMVFHALWHVLGSAAIGHFVARWWHASLMRRQQAEDAARRLGAPRRRRRARPWRRRWRWGLLLAFLVVVLGWFWAD